MKYLKVEQLENKNQFLVRTKEKYYFQSYNSLVAVYDRNKNILTLGVDWDYSNTTRKHLYIFIDQYCSVRELNGLYYAKNKRQIINDLIKRKIIKLNNKMC